MSKTQIFVVLVMDRHISPKIIPFTDEKVAIQHARKIAEENASEGATLDETNPSPEHHLYFCEYSIEGDYVSVQSKIIDAEVEETEQ